MKSLMPLALAALLAVGVGAGGYAVMDSHKRAYDRAFAERVAEIAAERERQRVLADQRAAEEAARLAEEARLRAEAEAAARAERIRQQAASFSATATPAGGGFNPLAPPGGGYNPLAAAQPGLPGTPSPSPVALQRGAATALPDGTPLNPDFANLPDTEGVQIVYQQCTWCHSATVFRAQHVTRARWDYLLSWMVTDQGMPEPTPEDRVVMLEYLVRHFGADRS